MGVYLEKLFLSTQRTEQGIYCSIWQAYFSRPNQRQSLQIDHSLSGSKLCIFNVVIVAVDTLVCFRLSLV